MKTVYEITRVINNERKGTTSAVQDKDGKTSSAKRWKGHSEEILYRPQPEYPLVVDKKGNEIKRVKYRFDRQR